MQTARSDLSHLNLDVGDLDVSERFYRDVLDLPSSAAERHWSQESRDSSSSSIAASRHGWNV
jgi:catechol-2,3-dioxygenase